jgi:hypothetical protein
MNKRLILIISSSRSGTNALADVLKKYFPNCYYEGEIFGGGVRSESLEILKKQFPEIDNFVYKKHDCELNKKDCISGNCDENRKNIILRMIWMEENFEIILDTLMKNRGNVTIIKICDDQLSTKSVERIINKFNPKIIILKRVMFFSYISRIKAMSDDTWKDKITSDVNYNINENNINEYMDKVSNWFYSINKIVKNNCVDLTFSELFEGDEGFIKLDNLLKDWKYKDSPDGVILPGTLRQDARTDKSLLFMLNEFSQLSKECQQRALKLPGDD